MEIAEMLERRRIDICCLQETRWKSNGVCHVNSDKEKYKLFWNGQKTAKNGFGVFVRELLAQEVLGIKRINSRLIELNGHVGEKTDGFDNVHGGFGYGKRNEDGNRIFEFAESHGFCLLNIYFRKRLEHLITYKSGPSATQIDFFAVKQPHRRLFKNVKVIPGESCILAGAHINDVTSHKQTALHLACLHGHSHIVSILIGNNINVNAIDDTLNNALHVACQYGHLDVVKVLLTQSDINIASRNSKGYNPLHVLGHHSKESSSLIFDLFIRSFPQYPVDQVDANGNSVLMLAYFNGNSSLCRAIVKHGATLGTKNKEGMSIFNAPVATKQLLFKMLDMLKKEPPWTDGENCLQCDVKFGLTTRKHHCRHCGRLLCSRCSAKEVPIIKFELTKPVRVCDLCFDVLSLSSH
ncbi:hypothetical protein HELRODRAFT_190418 [Helobdella robusta]|uniref:FYVE-type domain-containing protein n=1 Tax=Helobdella robusta TaxID=6412 RepID=T1FRZ4_HELRO|nr:hypothetical protein HELRODRAFT_190418 [Helobdella robusta]ESO10241.1 hypothetical protein HELRODRAFT_190418 [Helobdella robusta]